MKIEEIDNWFTYHPPTADQQVAYEKLRTDARQFARAINDLVPDCADKTAAMRKLRDAVMTANAAIACYVPPRVTENFAVRDAKEEAAFARDATKRHEARND